ncbi:MAG: YedE family putative selenium transporter [Chloroflexota bacterium]
MNSIIEYFKPKKWVILGGLAFGILGALLVNWGNPGNMGTCVACFIRDITGALGLHRAGVVQYIRPEIIGFGLGAFITALAFREWRPRGGSSPIIRFFLGAFAMIGALVFLGCPVRLLLRLGGGDLNAVTGLAGLLVGIAVAVFFLKRGFSLGRAGKTHHLVGLIIPIVLVGLLIFAIIETTKGLDVIYTSESGPGSMYASLAVSLVVGLAVGFIFQRTRLCTVGAWRDVMLVRSTHLLSGIIAIIVGALVTNYIVGNFAEGTLIGNDIIYSWGFENQPVAHNNHLWNFLGMSLAGMAFIFAGACPLRNLIIAGEGDADAGVFILGLIAGAAFSHNFLLASSPSGIGANTVIAVFVGLAFCLTVGFLMHQKA